ncbi:MAG: TonB-dependent receptor [Proteobacteria bacterium]|jgi:vitamin B12 transporter|nr:TonB-dependent receptor [Pseudomonadota bacterium]MCG6935016.1 TonB-dependent receptor [Pseudomonadota bacterium]
MRCIHRVRFIGLMLVIFTCSTATATEADAVIVTATRSAQTMDETLASVSVINRRDIEQSQAHDVLELLRLQAGIDISSNGGPGAAASLLLRGTNANQTLILIDGVRAGSATTGSFAWQHLALSEIDRIEIVRGPHAAQYGSDAMGGVIQIFTRENNEFHLRGQLGSYQSKLVDTGIGGGDDKFSYSLNFSALQTDNYSATNDKNSNFNPDTDPYQNRSTSGSLKFNLSESTELKFSGWYASSNNDYDAFGGEYGTSENENGVLNATLSNQTTLTWYQSFSVGISTDDSTDTSGGLFGGTYQFVTNRWTADWQHDLTLDQNNLLTLGLSTLNDDASNKDISNGTTTFDETVSDNAVFGILTSRWGNNDLNLSGRFDDYTSFGTHGTGQLAWGYNTSKSLRFTASYGTAFRAPVINELYFPNYGNPDLQPETSQTTEIGVRYKISPGMQLNANAYYTTIDNLIQAFEVAPFVFQASNIGEAQITGLELEHRWQINDTWSVDTNLTLMKAIDTTTDMDLLRRPRTKLGMILNRQFQNGGNLGLEWIYASDRADEYFNNTTFNTERTTLPAYHLINLSARIRTDKRLWLEGRIDNVLDEDYELAYGYNTPGVSVYAGVNYVTGI